MKTKILKVYISGPISGLPESEAKANFERAERFLRCLRMDTVNPMKLPVVDLPNNPTPIDRLAQWKKYMVQDIAALFDCNGIYMLPDWEKSKGARIEHAIASEVGHFIIYHNSPRIPELPIEEA